MLVAVSINEQRDVVDTLWVRTMLDVRDEEYQGLLEGRVLLAGREAVP